MYSLIFLITAVAFAAFAGLCKIIYGKTPLSKGGRTATLIAVSLGVFGVVGVHGYIVFGIFKSAVINNSSLWGAAFISALCLAPSIYMFEKLLQKYSAFVKRRDERGHKLDVSTSFTSTTQTTTTTWRVTVGEEAEETALDGLSIAFLIAAAYNIGYIVAMYFLTGELF